MKPELDGHVLLLLAEWDDSAQPPRHPALPEGQRWACVHPERPDEDGRACYLDSCPPCWMAFEAMARRAEPMAEAWWHDSASGSAEEITMVEARLRNLRRLADAGLLRPSDSELVLV